MPFHPLPPLLAKKAKDELNEDPERNEEDVRILREWILAQPHLKARLDDQFLLNFIRASKHSMERAKKKIDLFYSIRNSLPEVFKNRLPDNPKILGVLRSGVFAFLPKPLHDDGPRIGIYRPGFADPEKYSMIDAIRPTTMINDLSLMNDDNLVVSGLVQILDLTNLKASQLFQLDFGTLKKLSMLTGEGSALRHCGTHIVNAPSFFEKVFTVMKSFMTEKQKSRLYVHGNSFDSLHKYIPQQFLPTEYGGENGSISETAKHWENTLQDNYEFFVECDKHGVVEELRPPDSEFNAETLFGIPGTFRKLEVD